MVTATTLGYACIGGLLPSIIWLYFLLKEDASHPEPKQLIALAFIAGMFAVPLAIPFENMLRTALFPNVVAVFTGWALIEELLKYLMAAGLILWRSAVDEAPDYVIYMLTVALGFAAAENMLFVWSALREGGFIHGLFTDNIRFLGSTLLHVVASASIGFALAFSSRANPGLRAFVAAAGLILAIGLHTAFNTLIMSRGASDAASTTLGAFFLVWTVAVIFFAAFEVLKYFQYRTFPKPLRP